MERLMSSLHVAIYDCSEGELTEAIGCIIWLKPGHKASVTSKCRQPCRETNEQPACGDTQLF